MRYIIYVSLVDAIERILRITIFLFSVSWLVNATKIQDIMSDWFNDWVPFLLFILLLLWFKVSFILKDSFCKSHGDFYCSVRTIFFSRINNKISYRKLVYALSSFIQLNVILIASLVLDQYFLVISFLFVASFYFFTLFFSRRICKFFYHFGVSQSQLIFVLTILTFLFPFIISEKFSPSFLTLLLLYGIRFSSLHFMNFLVLTSTLANNLIK